MIEEEWRAVVGYEGIYEVSNRGKVRSVGRYICLILNGKQVYCKGKHMKLRKNEDGYMRVNLRKDNKSKGFGVHRLVAQAFVPNVDNKPEINHKDSDRANNNIGNLEWCTHAENNMYAYTSGKRRTISKHIDKNTLYNLYVIKGLGYTNIGKLYGYSMSSVKRLVYKYGFERHPRGDFNNRYNITKEWLTDELKSKTAAEISKQLGSSRNLIDHYIKKFNIRGIL